MHPDPFAKIRLYLGGDGVVRGGELLVGVRPLSGLRHGIGHGDLHLPHPGG